MFILELDCTEDEFYAMACQSEIQIHKAAQQDHRGKPPGQNLEATRSELEKLKGWMPEAVRTRIDRLVAAGGEGNKPQ